MWDLFFVAVIVARRAIVAARATVIAARSAVVVAAFTVFARLAFAFYVSFRFWEECTHREAVFACFLVYFYEFYFYGVAFFDS